MQYMDDIKQSVRHTLGQVLWTHKIHEKQADIYLERFHCLKILEIIFSVAASAGIITTIFNDSYSIKIMAAVVSVIATCLAAYFSTFDLVKMADVHRKTAAEIIVARERLILLLLKIKTQKISENEAINEYEEIERLITRVYSSAPSTTEAAVKRARKAMGIHGDNEITNEEINSGLPDNLKE